MNHPIHSIFVHFPAGLIPIAILFFLIFLYTRRIFFERISITLLGFSLIFLGFAISTGVYDWYSRYMFFMFPIIIIKIFLSIILVLLIVLIWNIRNKHAKNNSISALSNNYGYILLFLLLFPVVLVIGYFGGNLVYPSELDSKGDMVRIGSKIYINKCYACHPYGQGIYDPLIFPGSKESFGSAAIIQSKFFDNKDMVLKYIRNPKKMPKLSEEQISNSDFNYIYEYLKYLKYGENIKLNIGDSAAGKKVFDESCSDCHDNFTILDQLGKGTILSSTTLQNGQSFDHFLRTKTNRKINSSMPLFDSTHISSINLIHLYKYLQTKIELQK